MRISSQFGGVTRQLDAVYGKHLPANQALPVAEVVLLGKELGDFVQARNEGGKRCEVRSAIATEGDKGALPRQTAP